MSNDEAWMMIFLLLCSAQAQGKEFNVNDIFEQEKADTQFVSAPWVSDTTSTRDAYKLKATAGLEPAY